MRYSDVLKSISDKALAENPSLQDTPLAASEDISDKPQDVVLSKPHLWQTYTNLLNKLCKNLSVRREELTRNLAWRCDFFLPSTEICNTANGLVTGFNYARKTCAKCARPRKNPLTLEQEITREHLIEELMDFEDISYEEARHRLAQV